MRIVLGAVLVAAGLVVTVMGVLDAIETHGDIESDAVARGTIRSVGAEPVTFEVPAGGERDYTVYLIFERNLVNRDVEESAAVRDTSCRAQLPNEREVAFSGSRQGVRTSIGRATTVGHFSAPPGGVEVRCAYGTGTIRSRIQRPESVAYVVTPGKPSAFGSGAGLIIAGVAGALAGGGLLAWGLIGSRRRV